MDILDELYPEIPIPLDHKDPYTLLIAVLLSAQCTDERVNQITPKLFARADNPFDMVLMDLQMPVMDGVQAARAILSHGERLERRAAKPKIFALTADVAVSVIQECRDAGMDGFLGKPIDRGRLGRVMRSVTEWVTNGRAEAFHAERAWEVA